jgi:hypothetical protein
MEHIDQLVQEELARLDDRISTLSTVPQYILNLFEDSFHVRSLLDSAQEYYNRKDYTSAYKALLTALSFLVDINKQILDKYDLYLSHKESNDA